MLPKSPDAYRTISEVAAELDVPQHVLRFWESKFSAIRPMKRAGGRRFYRPDDVDLLRGVRKLLYGDGFTIKGVQKLFREQGPRHIADIGRAALAAEPVIARPGMPALRLVHNRTEPVLPPREGPLTDDQRDRLTAALDELMRLRAMLESRRAARDWG